MGGPGPMGGPPGPMGGPPGPMGAPPGVRMPPPAPQVFVQHVPFDFVVCESSFPR